VEALTSEDVNYCPVMSCVSAPPRIELWTREFNTITCLTAGGIIVLMSSY